MIMPTSVNSLYALGLKILGANSLFKYQH